MGLARAHGQITLENGYFRAPAPEGGSITHPKTHNSQPTLVLEKRCLPIAASPGWATTFWKKKSAPPPPVLKRSLGGPGDSDAIDVFSKKV